MILIETLRQIAESQKQGLFKEEWTKREMLNEIDISTNHALILSGIRRCGKSTLLKQLMNKTKGYSYFNFEDPRALSFEIGEFEKLDSVLHEVYGDGDYYFFDEIQNVEKWEFFVRHLLDKKKKIVITGSNASLLSKELGTKLTGRHLRYELFPFSYNEMLEFVNKKAGINSFEDYFENGGFPEFLKSRKPEMMQELLNDIIARDIVVRNRLRDVKTIKEMAVYLLSNAGKEFSYNILKKAFNLGSANTVISFVSFFEDSYLLFTVPRFDYSLKKQSVNPKKAYAIDTGFAKANSVSFSSDKGRALENLVFLHLRRKYREIFYFREKSECDFVVKEKGGIKSAIQVCYSLDEDNKNREIDGLKEDIEKFKLDVGLILTYNQEDELKVNGRKIKVLPVWKWIIDNKNFSA